MRLILNGAGQLGLYLILILAPLLLGSIFRPAAVSTSFLVNLSSGLGYVGFAVMALELALVSRVQTATAAFGLDVLQQFHKEIGLVACGLVLAHPILLVVAGYPARILWVDPSVPWSVALGTLAILLLAVLIATSIWRKRFRLSYEVWQLGHGLLTIAVILVAGIHIVSVGRFVEAAPLDALWICYLVLLLGLFAYYRIVLPLRLMKRPWRVVENRVEAGDSRTLRLIPDGHRGWSDGFEAGQFAWIHLGRSPFSYDQHPISMSSNGDLAAENGEVGFTIKNLGDWSGSVVPAVRPGDRVWIDGPYGVFTLDREQGPGYAFLAGGVGVTPLRSMLATMAEREDVRPVVLFFAASSADDLTFRGDLEGLQERMNLKIVYVVSEPPPGWDGEQGRITEEVLRRHLPPKQYRRWQYFICGPSPLMDALEDLLPRMGVPEERIHTERFDMV
jgi:predicted ferric reductase